MFKKTLLMAGGILLSATFIPASLAAEEPVDLIMLNRIMDEGFNRSEVMDTLQYMTDVIGPRLTASPGHNRANEWALEKFAEWGLENGHLEGFDFGPGWDYQKVSVRMMTPRIVQLQTYPIPWTPGTNGVVRAEVVHAAMKDKDDFEKYEGKLEGKIVLFSAVTDKNRPTKPLFTRRDDDNLDKLADYNLPSGPPDLSSFEKFVAFFNERAEFLAKEGALVMVAVSPRDAALIESGFYMYTMGDAPAIPGVTLTHEDYSRIVRLLDLGEMVELEVETETTLYTDADGQAYNALAEIPGRGRNPEIVMAGGHFDSWFVGDGAVDDGAGSAVVMEALRILAALEIKPKRTIRVALWGGEEQGLYGSIDYVNEHFASRPIIGDPERAKFARFFWMNDSWPITYLEDSEKFSAYFNLDNGSGKIRGIYGEANMALQPIFEAWFAPVGELGAGTVVLNGTGGTDHLPFIWNGLPGFQFIQDPLDYGARLHHTQIDTFDHVEEDDLKQASVIMAWFLYNAATRDERLPRVPVPQEPPAEPEEEPEEDLEDETGEVSED